MTRSPRRIGLLPAATVTTLVALLSAACAPDAEIDDEQTEMEEIEEAPEAIPLVETTEPQRLADYDLDGDGMLGPDEFGTWLDRDGFGDVWVYEADEDLDVDGVAERLVIVWDRDRDALVSQEEWDTGVRAWYGPDDPGPFIDWDRDGDSELDANEVAEALETRGMYDRIDLDDDAVIDDEELADWFFDVIDTNDDDRVDTTEWDAAVEQAWIG